MVAIEVPQNATPASPSTVSNSEKSMATVSKMVDEQYDATNSSFRFVLGLGVFRFRRPVSEYCIFPRIVL